MRLTKDEKKALADHAAIAVVSKLRLLASIGGALRGIESDIRSWQSCWNEWAKDPEVEELRVSLDNVNTQLSTWRVCEDLMRIMGCDPNDYEYARVGEDRDLLAKEQGIDVDKLSEEEEENLSMDGLPFEDAMTVYKRNR